LTLYLPGIEVRVPFAAHNGKKSAEEIASYMTSDAYANMGKTWMVKRNIEYLLKDGK
jgi:hypothetical protein